ncbi:MAG: AbrB/MazE/SpoVT family DNA-binding domain-containing protein [Oceanipulchritudo sp.]|jgi:virulence-associated protein VagC
MKTRVFRSGNSMALRIPKQFKAREGEVSIEQVGERWIVEPVKSAGWPAHFFRNIRISDPAFTRPDQGRHRVFDT